MIKYYSDVLNKNYDTLEECEDAEKQYLQEKENAELIEKQKKEEVSKDKKMLAKKIEEADAELDLAMKEYDKAVKEATAIVDKANDVVQQASKKKYEAVYNFNKKYGVYTTSVTYEKLMDEFNRIFRNLRFF